jgi:hypothetical protein
MYTDTFANRPAYGYQGRLFISTDSGQIFEDTGSAWTLVADAGVGGGTLSSVCLNGNTTATGIIITAGGLSSNSITNTGNTAGSVLFAGASGLESQSNATFFWDNTNKRLGIGNASPGAPLDIHGTGTQLQLNGTGSNNSYIQFQNAGVSKWRIGNTYSAGANSYGIYNNGLSSLALTINSTNNGIITTGYLNIENALGSNQIYLAKLSSDTYGTIQTEAGGGKYSLGNVSNLGTLGTAVITWTSGLQVGINNISPTYDFDVTGTGRFTGILRLGSTLSNGTYFYTLPSATGTLALTSQIAGYLPLTGGTLTGQLYINPTNTGTIGLDVASDTISFRSDNLEGSKRQLLITMGSGTLIQFTAQGYGANYGTDLAFYTATTGGVNASPGIYITGTNNRVGIGTGTPGAKLDVIGAIRSSTYCNAYNGTNDIYLNSIADLGLGALPAIQVASNHSLQFATNNSLKMIITNTGFIGIGIATPTYKLQVATGVAGNIANFSDGIAQTMVLKTDASSFFFDESNNGNIIFQQAGTERMRILSGTYGKILFGNGLTTDFSAGHLCIQTDQTTENAIAIKNTSGANNGNYIVFVNSSGGGSGSITQTGATTVLYVATSDYRLKDNILPIENAIDRILKIKPVTYNWKDTSNEKGEGFIAHELQEIVPLAVSGIKDEMNEDGTIKAQGIDYGKLTPLLVKAIQELNEKLVRNNIN